MSLLTTEVRRCPVCGSTAALIDADTDEGHVYTVICLNVQHCGLGSGFCKSASEAIRKWENQLEYAKMVKAEIRDKA